MKRTDLKVGQIVAVKHNSYGMLDQALVIATNAEEFIKGVPVGMSFKPWSSVALPDGGSVRIHRDDLRKSGKGAAVVVLAGKPLYSQERIAILVPLAKLVGLYAEAIEEQEAERVAQRAQDQAAAKARHESHQAQVALLESLGLDSTSWEARITPNGVVLSLGALRRVAARLAAAEAAASAHAPA